MMLFGSRKVLHGDISVFAGNYSFLVGRQQLSWGCVRLKFGVCVLDQVVMGQLKPPLPTRLGDLRQLIYHLPTQISPGLSQEYERGKVLICWSRFLLVSEKVAPEGCATSRQVQLADFFKPCASLAPIGGLRCDDPFCALERKGVQKILGQAVCNTSRHVCPSSVDWADCSHPNGLRI